MIARAFRDIWSLVMFFKGWFSLAHKHNISITSENTHDISVSISRNIRGTNPLICLTLFSLAHKHKISTRKTNMFVFLALMLMLMLMRLCLCLCASENSIRQISGFVLLMFLLMLTLMSWVFSLVMLMLCLCASENQP